MVRSQAPHAASMAGAAGVINTAFAVPMVNRATSGDPFAILDKQEWVNPDNMTWSDWKTPPNTNWADPKRKGSKRNFNIAMVAVDYPDQPFVLTLPAKSDIFGNPQPLASGLKREDVPNWYRDFLNKPSEINKGHTLHEYWMSDSAGQYGVDLTVFGAYRLPSNSYQYGIDDEEGGFNPGACPEPGPCSVDLRTDALGAWRADVGNATADQFELAFILSAGQDESSTWQEFGEMKFAGPEDVPEEFGPPGNSTLPNWAKTRYVNWTSWAAASTIWPNAGGGSSTQGESSGLATFAHELSHLLGIGDNYNNPYGVPARRAYTGPWSMLSRGSFNGPGGPHTRWQIPPTAGGSMGSLHTVRDKHQIGLLPTSNILQIDRAALADSGLVVAEITARAVDPGVNGIIGFNVSLPKDLSPACDTKTDPLCDGGNYNAYNVEVIDRMGADSFCPDSGVMISKSKNSDRQQPFQWTIDANPQDINVIDFYLPNGKPKYLTIGDYRQLADALFHAGTRSGSKFEFEDEANRLHFYIVDINRNDKGELSYTIGVRSLDGNGISKRGLKLDKPVLATEGYSTSPASGVLYTVELKNKGNYKKNKDAKAQHGQDLEKYLEYDVFRAKVEIDGKGWKAEVPNALSTAKNGEKTSVKIAVAAGEGASKEATVKLTVSSESDPSKVDTKTWKVKL
ncbi:M6 metalloprotease [Aaosphaeria arxii CBS 175.79]|uniref:M6 metalloprotease n=1 Tax=Aaosphaeria arxii CBS 175.79 TaxID=1450172 RepID=A0A6A5XPG7_9PLEO|nr:M6 metalloprotease [Aaosphaeria arxii CBS 175.79]KAF2014244.1 M6 metalloprotease [Aaosphaeria arxii CBS 175.79]